MASSVNDPELYTVVVSGIGKVYDGHFFKCAEATYIEYVVASNHVNESTPESGKDVKFYVDGELVREHIGFPRRPPTPKRPKLKRSKHFLEED